VAQVIERDRGVCWLCGRPGAHSADHVLPASKGGTDDLANLAGCARRVQPRPRRAPMRRAGRCPGRP